MLVLWQTSLQWQSADGKKGPPHLLLQQQVQGTFWNYASFVSFIFTAKFCFGVSFSVTQVLNNVIGLTVNQPSQLHHCHHLLKTESMLNSDREVTRQKLELETSHAWGLC